MKQTISREMAEDLGLLKDPYKAREVRLYQGQYLFEGWHAAEKRRAIAEYGAEVEARNQLDLPNCVDKELMLFEFEEDEIRRAVERKYSANK